MNWKRNSLSIHFLDKPHLYYYLKLDKDAYDWVNPVRKDGALILPFLWGIEVLFISSPP
jgi:hypothetical protein